MSKHLDTQSLAFIKSRLGDALVYCIRRAKQMDAAKMKDVDCQVLQSKKDALPQEKSIHQGGWGYNHNSPFPTANKKRPNKRI